MKVVSLILSEGCWFLEFFCSFFCFQSAMLEDTEDDLLLVKQRSQKQQKKTESSDTATIKKLHVSSANLQRVSCFDLCFTSMSI